MPKAALAVRMESVRVHVEPKGANTTTAVAAGGLVYAGTQDFAERARNFSLPTPAFQRPWYSALDDDTIQRILLLCPREHGKTSVVLSFVLHNFWKDKHTRQGIISQTAPHAKRFMREVKTALLRDPFGPDWQGEPWGASELNLAGTNHGKDVSLFCVGRTGQITGAHADTLIFDDVESVKTVRTETTREMTRQWFTQECEPVLSAGGRAIVVGTRKHFADLYGQLLEPGSGWVVLDNALSAFGKDGEPIWPERWPKEVLLDRKARMEKQDIRAWASEYENNPIPAANQMFTPTAWTQWYPATAPKDLRWWQALDFALSEKTSADFTVCLEFATDREENVYLGELYRTRIHVSRLAEFIDACYITAHGAGRQVRQVFYEKANTQAPILRETFAKVRAPVKGLPVVGDKVLHARRAEAKGAAGHIFRPGWHTQWWGEFAAELARFPKGAYDDQVDALSYGIDGALPILPKMTAPLSIGQRQSPWGFGQTRPF